MRRFLHHPLPDEGEVLLDEGASHHLLQVAKVARGSEVGLFDGRGREASAALVGAEDGRARVLIQGPAREAKPPRDVHLVLAVLKGDAMAHALRMATEAGATHVWPTLTQRTVPKGDRAERWQRIAQSAAQQCGRADVPSVAALGSLAEQLTRLPSGVQRFVAAPGGPLTRPASGPVAVAVGPEGGWTDAELRHLTAEGWAALGLGRWVLRADTAAAIAVAHMA